MRWTVQLLTTYHGFKIIRTELDKADVIIDQDLLMTFNTYGDAKSMYEKILKNISQELFTVVGVSSSNQRSKPVFQQVEYVSNDLINLQRFYE